MAARRAAGGACVGGCVRARAGACVGAQVLMSELGAAGFLILNGCTGQMETLAA